MNVPGMKRLAPPMVWACVTGLAASGALAAQTAGTLVGTVLDATSLEPLAGARAELPGQDKTVVADGEGRFVFDGVFSGDVTVRVAHDGYGTVVETYAVTALEATLI